MKGDEDHKSNFSENKTHNIFDVREDRNNHVFNKKDCF